MNWLIYAGLAFVAFKLFRGQSQTAASDGIPSPGVTTEEVPQRRQAGHNTNDNADMEFSEADAETAAEKAKGAKYLP